MTELFQICFSFSPPLPLNMTNCRHFLLSMLIFSIYFNVHVKWVPFRHEMAQSQVTDGGNGQCVECAVEDTGHATKYCTWPRMSVDSSTQNLSRMYYKSFEKVTTFKYLETTIINQNYLHEQIKTTYKLRRNVCYNSVRNLQPKS